MNLPPLPGYPLPPSRPELEAADPELGEVEEDAWDAFVVALVGAMPPPQVPRPTGAINERIDDVDKGRVSRWASRVATAADALLSERLARFGREDGDDR